MKTIIIDLSNVRSKDEILKLFNDIFSFTIPPRTWDGFNDWFRNLDTDSAMYKREIPDEKDIHLILRNIHHVKKFSEEDYNILIDLLFNATDKGQRGDDVNLTFEVSNDYG